MMVTSTGCSFIKSGSLAHDVIDAAKEKAKNFAKEKWADIEEWATEDENMALKDVDSYGKMAYDQAKIILDSFDSKDVDRAKKVFCPYIQEEHGDELSDDIKECLDYVDGKIVSYDDPIIELSSEKTDENGKVTRCENVTIENVCTDTGQHYEINIMTYVVNKKHPEGQGVVYMRIDDPDKFSDEAGYDDGSVKYVSYNDVWENVLD